MFLRDFRPPMAFRSDYFALNSDAHFLPQLPGRVFANDEAQRRDFLLRLAQLPLQLAHARGERRDALLQRFRGGGIEVDLGGRRGRGVEVTVGGGRSRRGVDVTIGGRKWRKSITDRRGRDLSSREIVC